MKPKILVVEDDLPLAESIDEYLTLEGYEVKIAANGEDAVTTILQWQPALVILDVMLPKKDGLTVCREVRPLYNGYIVMFTAREEEIDQIVGLEIGADDYLLKPVKPRLLLAKIKAFLRREQPMQAAGLLTQAKGFISFGELVIASHNRTVTLGGLPVQLTDGEYDLLILLAKNAGTVLSRNSIVEQLKGYYYDGIERGIDNHISQLRKKLGDDARNSLKIKTVRSKGYLFVVSAW
ncbi:MULTISPECIES: response regulator transcription factor [Pseudoalteromonas]|uniref:response regulator transcription factor n=1 Tax=Pseudoalteromonas TaxID=53246 RepID=UPI000C32044E|nr:MULTISPECIES: response regulator transcription factor [Pseudoalteromonas]PKG68506.1 DNA-binding response regulator [Pseudoalteromonas arctica]PKG71898.1 DNA-binding response regulator [Pseudoalteromonas sp. GutCa3]